MSILTLRTDKPEAELGLYKGEMRLDYTVWEAHRQLAETIHKKIEDLLKSNRQTLNDLQGLVAFVGPGSFTGLRIGLAVANSLAESLRIPIVGTSGEDWAVQGIKRLQTGTNESIVLPEYGSEPHITAPRK